VLFTTQDEHFGQSLYLWGKSATRVKLVARSDGQLSGGRSGSVPCAVTRSSAVCVAASAVSPPRLERFRFDNGGRYVLFDPNAELRVRAQPRVEQLSFKLADGRVATGTLLFRPGPPPARAPLFVNYYYCPGYLRGGVGDSYPFAPLVDSGFVVACLNTVPFKHWGDGADRERAALASVTSLVRLLDKRGWIDPGRVGMGGFSAGSEATMWVAMNSKLLRAAAVASPQYEPTDYWMSSVRGRDVPRILRDFEQVGSPDEDPERWKIISPALNADRIKAPLLMQLPEQEMRAAIELYARLSNTSTPVEMYAFPDEAHIKIQPRHQFAVYRRNLEWFRYWLQGHSDPDPTVAPQYRRWDALRLRRASAAIK
jgi:dipeptidyl aminopeptidase/acylaminoacyl peptidase